MRPQKRISMLRYMMKMRSLFLVLLTISLSAFLLIESKGKFNASSSGKIKTLEVYFPEDSSSFSFSPYDSDALSNLVIMEHIVGTLVKFSPTGRFEPYLATQWNVSDDQLKWSFTLQQGLKFNDGTQIDPDNFVKAKTKILKFLGKNSQFVPIFSTLIGWNDFQDGKVDSIKGLRSDQGKIIYEFTEVPDALLEYLSMPYYGAYPLDHFNDDGSWKDIKTSKSSAGYFVSSVKDDSLHLKKEKIGLEGKPTLLMKSYS